MGDAGRQKKGCYQPVGRALVGLLALLACVVAATSPAAAQKRVALIIGNAAYKSVPLANPVNDAGRIAAALTRVGFDVVQANDLPLAEMRRALATFAGRLTGDDTVALFYYAGHGVQLNGQNYLLPVDGTFKSEADIRLAGIRLDEILEAMRPEKSRLSIAILDACRDNPFPAVTRSIRRGLAPVNAPAGTLIAYSTAPGHVALDGVGGLSPYAKAFATALGRPGLTIEDVFKTTRLAVMQDTGGQQVPWEHSSLIGRFVFQEGAANRPTGWEPITQSARPILPVANPVPDARALYRDFLIHEEGRGVSRNPETAADRLLAAYKAGDRQAEAMLFRSYRRLRMATRRAIQRRLSAAGHDPGVADGFFGRRTRRALEAYGR